MNDFSNWEILYSDFAIGFDDPIMAYKRRWYSYKLYGEIISSPEPSCIFINGTRPNSIKKFVEIMTFNEIVYSGHYADQICGFLSYFGEYE